MLTLLIFPNSCADPQKDYQKAFDLFENNKIELKHIIRTLLEHPNIKRVEDLSFIDEIQFGSLSISDKQSLQSLLDSIARLGLKKITVSRNGSQADGDLISIIFWPRYPMRFSQTVLFVVSYTLDEDLIAKAHLFGHRYHVIQTDKNWYIVEIPNNSP